MSQSSSSSNLLTDPLFRNGVGLAIVFMAGIIFIELGRDESARAAVGTAGEPMIVIAD